MVCSDCKGGRDHESCKERNKAKDCPDCDCQHRVDQKTIVKVGDGSSSQQPAAGAA